MRCNRIRPPHRKKKDINNFKGDLRRYLLIRTLVDKRNMHRMSVNLFFHVLQNALKRPLNDFETVKALVHHTLIHQNFTSSFCINESFHSKQDVWYKDSSKYFVSYESHENETRIIFWRPWPSRTESVQVIHENLKQRNHNREYSLVEAIRQKLFTFDEDSSNFFNDNDASANTC